MPRNRRNVRSQKRVGPNQPAKMVNRLDQLVEMQKTQLGGSTPRVEDPEKLMISPNRLFTMERSLNFGNITLSASPQDTFGAYALRLSDLPVASELISTFDDYRIIQIEYVFTPISQDNTHGALVTVVDYDTNTSPVAINDLLQYRTCQISEPGFTVTRRLTPRVADALYSGAFTSYGLAAYKWISTDSSNVFHYGLRWAIAGVSNQPTNAPVYTVWCRAVLQFRATR
jgi:hypothetical protein